MSCPSPRRLIAHNLKVSVQSQSEMHQENYRGIPFFALPTSGPEIDLRIVCENADTSPRLYKDNPRLYGRFLFMDQHPLLIFRNIIFTSQSQSPHTCIMHILSQSSFRLTPAQSKLPISTTTISHFPLLILT